MEITAIGTAVKFTGMNQDSQAKVVLNVSK